MKKNNTIKLSPIVRLKLSFDAELNIDKGRVFGIETFERYLDRQREAEAKQESLIKSLFLQNAFLFLLISGQNWTIPGLGIEIASIPAIREIILFSTSMTFFFLCAYFVTNQCYIGVIDQFGNRIANSDLVDPDFFNASRKHYDFFLKVFRTKLNFWGVDFYQHKLGFLIFSWVINFILYLVILAIPAAHVMVTWAATVAMFNSELNSIARYFLATSVAVINLGGFLMVLGMSKEFNFTVLDHADSKTEKED